MYIWDDDSLAAEDMGAFAWCVKPPLASQPMDMSIIPCVGIDVVVVSPKVAVSSLILDKENQHD